MRNHRRWFVIALVATLAGCTSTSPGGSEAEAEVRIRVATIDDAAPVDVGTAPFPGCTYNYECTLTWSPDGSQIAFRRAGSGEVDAFDAAGAGEAGPITELTYRIWERGTYPNRA